MLPRSSSRSAKAPPVAQPLQVRLLLLSRVVVGEAVHPDHLFAAVDEAFAQMGSEKSRAPGDQDSVKTAVRSVGRSVCLNAPSDRGRSRAQARRGQIARAHLRQALPRTFPFRLGNALCRRGDQGLQGHTVLGKARPAGADLVAADVPEPMLDRSSVRERPASSTAQSPCPRGDGMIATPSVTRSTERAARALLCRAPAGHDGKRHQDVRRCLATPKAGKLKTSRVERVLGFPREPPARIAVARVPPMARHAASDGPITPKTSARDR